MLPTIIRKRNYASPSIFNSFFNDDFLPHFWDDENTNKFSPAVNVEENEKDYRIELAAPGLNKEDLKVSVDDGILSVSFEKKEEKKEEGENNFIRREFSHNSFKRSFRLPEETDVDKITAKHKNGVLNITIPKTEVKVQPVKEVKIS